jgi:NAD(P)-dependent dehydrogenase (short-subunit alcohol dehydrogenase family)
MNDKPVALVTGANQGIGLQIAKELAAKDFTVLVGSRDFARGEAAAQTIDGDARALQLDVTDGVSIAAAEQRIRAELGAGRAHRQCVERRWLADQSRGPELRPSLDIQSGVPGLQDRAQRDHASHGD